MNLAKLGLVIYAKDYIKLTQFYSTILHLEIIETDDEFALMETNSVEFLILQAPTSIAEKITIGDPPDPRENIAIKPVFFVQSIQSVRDLAKDHAGYVNHPKNEWRFRGNIVCDGYDPEGNIFQIRAKQAV